MKTWSQMDLREREELFGLLKQDKSIREIATIRRDFVKHLTQKRLRRRKQTARSVKKLSKQ